MYSNVHVHVHVLIDMVLSCPGVVNNRQIILHTYMHRHSKIQELVCYINLLTIFLPCSDSSNPNNKICLVICAVSLTCATWHGLCTHIFSIDPPPQPGYKINKSNICHTLKRIYARYMHGTCVQMSCTYVHILY